MPSFWKHVNRVIESSDLIIEVLDARMVEESRNKEIEDKIKRRNKKILYVINKCDLVNIGRLKEIKKNLVPSVFISSKNRLGTTLLKKKILEMSAGEKIIVGVVGYPNIGKSSVINALSGRGSARISAESGYTKGLQKIRVDQKILLIDTPGVFPHKEKDLIKHSKMGAIDYGRIKDPEFVALTLIIEEKEKIKQHYDIKENKPERILEMIAIKLKKISKGNKPNLEAAARFMIKEWQKGKITWPNRI